MKIKPKAKSTRRPTKAVPDESSTLRGWPTIAQFLSLPNSTVHRWAKEGMPVRREGRNVVANPDELNRWLQRTSGEATGVHVATPGSDLLKDLRASLAAQDSTRNSSRKPKNEPAWRSAVNAPRTKTVRKS